MGGDEINILLPGRNYGWPLVSTGRNYTGTLVSDEPWARPGMDNPRIHWVPSISPSSIIFYTGDQFPKWKNNLSSAPLQRSNWYVLPSTNRRKPSAGRGCSYRCISAFATSSRVPMATSTWPRRALREATLRMALC